MSFAALVTGMIIGTVFGTAVVEGLAYAIAYWAQHRPSRQYLRDYERL